MGGDSRPNLSYVPKRKRAEVGLFLPSEVNQRRGGGRGQKMRKNRKGGRSFVLCNFNKVGPTQNLNRGHGAVYLTGAFTAQYGTWLKVKGKDRSGCATHTRRVNKVRVSCMASG